MRFVIILSIVSFTSGIPSFGNARDVKFPVMISSDPIYNQLGACGKARYISTKQVKHCLDKAVASVPEANESNGPAGVFYSTVNSDLDDWVENRILHTIGNKTERRLDYQAWLKQTTSDCEATSQFGPGGSGLGADIGYCTATAQIALLQKGLDFRYRQRRLPD